jgi:hypothetical protein
MLVPFRHGIVKSQQQGNLPGFLNVQSNSVTLLADNSPLVINIANGASDYLISIENTITSAWAGFGTAAFPSGVNYWLYIDVNSASGLITYGKTRYNQVIASRAPVNPQIDQHWFDVASAKMKVWTGLTWQTKIRILVGEFANTTSVACFAYKSQVAINTPVNSGKIAFDVYGKPIRKSTGEFFTTDDSIYVNGIVSAPNSLETRRLAVTALEPIPARSIVALAEFDKVVVARYEDTGSRVLGFTNFAMSPGQTEEIVLSGVIESTGWSFLTANDSIWVELGQPTTINPFSVSSSRGMQQPIGRVIGPQRIRFNPPNFQITSTQATPPTPRNVWLVAIDTSISGSMLSYGAYSTHLVSGNVTSNITLQPASDVTRLKLTPGVYSVTFLGTLSADFVGNPITVVGVTNAPSQWPPTNSWMSDNTGGVADTESGSREDVQAISYSTSINVIDEIEFVLSNTVNPNTGVRTHVRGLVTIEQLNVTI